MNFPDRNILIDIIYKLRAVIFPEYFMNDEIFLENIRDDLQAQIEIALSKKFTDEKEKREFAYSVSTNIMENIPKIREALILDANAGFKGDPAATCLEEVILAYPGLFAIFVYRISHILYCKGIPLIPRLISEYAHSKTGIDIHPGANIGESFFIDHGTGVVIGETTKIGNNVKLYQGVTLGALSTKNGQLLSGTRRHPTIEDNVTIYAGATILGGDTVIGESSTIGGNAFITESVLPYTKVSGLKPLPLN